MTSWQVHWTSAADTGNGPLRASGYGYSPESARAALVASLHAQIEAWSEEAESHAAAVEEARREASA